MIDIGQSGVIVVKAEWTPSFVSAFYAWLFFGAPLFFWPFAAMVHHLPLWPPVAYLVALAGLLVVSCDRPRRVAVLIGDDGLVVRNFLRSWRIGWPQVAELVDGRHSNDWALTVLLADGRAVTCAATSGATGFPLGHPPIVRVLRESAARYGIPAELTGVAPWRPRAWEDAAAAARWYRARVVVWLLVTAAAVAGLVVVAVWNSKHPDYGPYFWWPFLYAVVIAAGAAVYGGYRWRQAAREAAAREPEVDEGDWFSVPLGRDRYAVGVIARKQPRGNLVLAYFFAPFESPRPGLDVIGGLRPADSRLVALCPLTQGGLAVTSSQWPLLGWANDWERSVWPVPVFARTAPEAKQSFRVYCDDQLRLVGEDPEPADPGATMGLPAWALASKESVVGGLNMRLRA